MPDTNKSNMESQSLRSSALHRYVVVPGYWGDAKEYRLSFLESDPDWDVFPGSRGGGILRASATMTNQYFSRFLYSAFPGLDSSSIPGTEIGNEAARALSSRILPLAPEQVPALAVAYGAVRSPKPPHIPTTIEHRIDGTERVILLSGKKAKTYGKAMKGMEMLAHVLQDFSIDASDFNVLDGPTVEVWSKTLGNIQHRAWWSMNVSGGKSEAEWQLAVLFYAAQIVAAEFKGFYSIHLCEQIEGEPNFRRHWTSNL